MQIVENQVVVYSVSVTRIKSLNIEFYEFPRIVLITFSKLYPSIAESCPITFTIWLCCKAAINDLITEVLTNPAACQSSSIASSVASGCRISGAHRTGSAGTSFG
jgi:hypothetical protein